MNDPIVLVSGGFDPIHPGHIALLRESAKHGQVHVILNSDDWLIRKKGFYFQNWEDRADILLALKCVADVYRVNDQDNTVSEAIRNIRSIYRSHPVYFANGGDRRADNIPEQGLCMELGIETLFAIGGEYKRSASSIIAPRRTVKRPWGEYVVLAEGKNFLVKILRVLPNMRTSLQVHKHREEHWNVLAGKAIVQAPSITSPFEIASLTLEEGHEVHIAAGEAHRLGNMGAGMLEVLEVQRGDVLSEEDIVRYVDDHGRA